MNSSFVKMIIDQLSAAVAPILKEELALKLAEQREEIRQLLREEIEAAKQEQ